MMFTKARSSTAIILLCALLSFLSLKFYPGVGSDGIPNPHSRSAPVVVVRPPNWETFRSKEMRRYFECNKAFASSTRPWWTDQEFRIVRELYQDLLRSERSGLVRGSSTPPGTYQLSNEVFDFSQIVVPYQDGEGKGRGLKAARDVQKGEQIFKATNNTVAFTDGHSYRKFLFAVNERFPSFACDVLMWAWVQDLEGDAFGIVVDLDNANLLNSDGSAANIRCGKIDERCYMNFYARQNINKGDEILGSYSEFLSDHSWSELGL